MSWHYLPELAAGSSDLTFSDSEPSAPSKLCRTAARSSCNVKEMVCFRCSPSGTTSKPLRDEFGMVAWMLCLPASHANPFPSPAKDSPKTTLETAGLTPSESFAKYDPDGCCWRTSQVSLLTPTLEEFSGTWPRQGSMRNGMLFQRPTLAPRIFEKGFGSWPTPRAGERGQYQRDHGTKGKERPTLTGKVKGWPTPTTRDDRGPASNHLDLTRAVRTDGRTDGRTQLRHWPTPLKTEGSGGPQPPAKRRAGGHTPKLRDEVGGESIQLTKQGQLNPAWVEWLMGWPVGWTDLAPLEMDKFLLWQQSLSRFLDAV